jgi:hypothetical protein
MTNGVSYGYSVKLARSGTLRSGNLTLVHSGYLEKTFSCSIRDNDEEFLLIEAADSLPSWVTPSVVENRVRNLFDLLTSQAT